MAVNVATDADFNETLKAHNKVIVKYYADSCGSCKLFTPKFKRLSNDERFAGIEFLEVDAENSPEARKAAGVDNLPFIAIFKDGALVEGHPTSKEEFVVGMLDKLKQ
jgi:thioredoxin 1